MTTATYPHAKTYANLAAIAIATGVVVISFALFGFLRSAVFGQPIEQTEEINPPPGLFERNTDAETFTPATPQPFPVPTATGEAQQYLDTPEQAMPGCTAQLDDSGNVVPGSKQCKGWDIVPDTYSNPLQQSGFRSGNGANVGKVDIGNKGGYYTTNGLGKKKG